MTDAEYNMHKARKMGEIDKILDKIKTSGYESLSAEEKKKLFEQKNNN
jgi:ribosome maturation protein Sdo1